MSDRGAFDDFRDLLDGRLDEADGARLRAHINADPALAAAFESYAAVHAATGAAPPAPASAVTFERLDAARRGDRIRRLRPWMAAAAALLLVAGGLAAQRRFTPHTVVLRAIPLRAPDVPADSGATVPSLLADWRPVADGKMRWLPTLDDGRAVARAIGRPILLWVYHPTCPICVEWDRTSFRDAGVQGEADEFVPVKLNVMKAPREIQQLFADDFERKWPYLAALNEDGATLLAFPGEESGTPEAVRENLAKALAARGGRAAPPSWSDANAACSATARGEQAFAAGDLGAAWREFDAVRALHVPEALSSAARRRLAEIERSASDALSAAMKLAATDEGAGARSLSDAAERFRGTPYGTDLAEVEQELRATGRLPVLVEAVPKHD
jgi:hypothetical protein